MTDIRLRDNRVRRWPRQWHEYHMAVIETKLLLEDAIRLKWLADQSNQSIYSYTRRVLLAHIEQNNSRLSRPPY